MQKSRSGKCPLSPSGLPMVVAPNLEALATQLSRNGLEEIWSPYLGPLTQSSTQPLDYRVPLLLLLQHVLLLQ